jgi:hypothetical protein
MSIWGRMRRQDADSYRRTARLRASSVVAAIAGSAVFAQAGFTTIVNDPVQLQALDGISFGSTVGDDGEFYYGRTNAGLAYRISQSSSVRNGYYSEGIHVTRIEFEHPVAGIGAYFSVSSMGFFNSQQNGGRSQVSNGGNGQTLTINGSGYHGLICSGAGTSSVVFVSRGPMSMGAIDLRPTPMGEPDLVTVPKNSDRHLPASKILANDMFAEGALLVKGPYNADNFELLPDGSFVYKPLPGYIGPDRFVYRATNGDGSAWSAPIEVTIDVAATNNAPSFVPGPDQQVNEAAGEQVVQNWATDITTGADDEMNQQLTWDISVDNPDLFDVQPTIDRDGTLRYTPGAYASGYAKVTVALKDSGGVDQFGTDTSESHTFTIAINALNNAPMLDPMEDIVLTESALITNAKATEMDFEESVVYTLLSAPEGASINRLSGQIHWEPAPEQMGQEFEFVVQVYGTKDPSLTTQTSFRVKTKGNNIAPEIREIPTIHAQPGQPIRFHVDATAETENLRFALGSEIDGPVMNMRDGRFAWTPKASHSGRSYEMTVYVTDENNAWSKRTFMVMVGDPGLIAKNTKKTANSALLAKHNSRKSTGGMSAQKIK